MHCVDCSNRGPDLAGDTVYDRAQDAIKALKLKLVPWAAVAAPLSSDLQADAGE